MAETAAHLVDRVLPQVPMREWVPHLKLLRSYPLHAILCRADRGHFSGIGGSCHEEEESLVSSNVVDFSIAARQRVHYRAGPESCSEGDEVV